MITPNNPKYELARQEWNRSIQKFPLVIAYCEDYYDVSNAVCWAVENNVDIRIRSGGHNYEGYSTGNKAMVIDLSLMNKIKIDSCNNTVKIQGGVNFGKLYNTLATQGYPFPGGTCPTVAASGYSLGGGWGYSSRYLGLGCDSIIEVEIIDYEGDLLVANDYIHSDLFWALRGAGGGNFGVVVSITFKLPPKVDKVTFFEITYPNSSPQTQIEFLNIWQKWIVSTDRKINMNAYLYNSESDGIYIYARGIYYGIPDNARELLYPFFNIYSSYSNIEYLPFIEAINIIAASYPPYEKFKTTGRFSTRYYSCFELEGIVDIVNQKRPKGSILTSINVYGLGGKTKDVGKFDTAFYYRNANYILAIQSVWEDNEYKEYSLKWVEENFKYLYCITEGSYINFPYLELPYYQCNYFGENVPRLKCVKHKYDPCNTFNFPQSIR
ncbi:FAD-binding protein [Romboutsia weinsteinii]|uniref:FAD-binding protein n=1 Tax=Romboutsia weinsteinii TaxID=2020949 RepID=A0A371J2W9_9FIRM|nr:FAD-binding protein [Romboutsia weinsteinii]